MLHREWDSAGGGDGNGGWKACDGTTPGHVADSRVHLYDRVVGFKPSAEEEEVTSRNPRAAAAARNPTPSSDFPRARSSCAVLLLLPAFLLVTHRVPPWWH